MNKAQQFQLCLEKAKAIVAAYRSECPEGCDPVATGAALAVAGIGAAATVGMGMYQASQQKKAAARAAAMGGAPTIPAVEFPKMPKYIPADFYKLNQEATRLDTNYFRHSDTDFAERHPGTVAAEKAFEAQTAKDQVGDSQFLPQMQQEALRAGLGSSLAAFGDAGPVLARGSGAEADVAKNLGLSVLAFQDRNRQNAQQSLSLAEQIFPRRQFGLTGKDYTGISLGNLSAQNAWNQANHAATVDELEFNAKLAAGNQATALQQGNAQAAAGAQASQAQAQMYGQIAQSAIKGATSAYGNYTAMPASTAARPQTYGGALNVGGSNIYL